MSERFPASVVRATPVVPSLSSAPGVWTMEQQLQAQAQGLWPVDPNTADPYFKNVSLLLHGDGTHGAQNNGFTLAPSQPAAVGSYVGYFDGSGDYLTFSSTYNLTGDFTIECWIYFTATPTGMLMGNMGTAPQSDYISLAATSIGFGQQTSGFYTSINWPTTLTTNAWHHIAITRSGSTIRAFLDGVIGTTTVSSSATFFAAGTSALGTYYNGTAYLAASFVSNFRIVKGQALYTGTFTPPTEPLTTTSQGTTAANVALLTCQNLTFVDNSPTPRTITAAGNAVVVYADSIPGVTRAGNITQGSFSPFGTLWSGYFDGAGDYLSLSSNGAFAFGTGDFTIEFWVFADTVAPTYQVLYDARTVNSGPNPTIYLTGASLRYLNNATDRIVGGNISLGVWNHVAVARSSGSTKLFLNGVQTGSTYADSTDYVAAPLKIGSGFELANYLRGNISNLRVVKGTALYTAAFTPPGSPLTAISNTVLLTCQSNRFVDNSATGAAITRNGDAAVSRFSPFAPPAPYDSSVIGGSGYFDGTGDALTINTGSAVAFGTGDFTVEFWLYFISPDADFDILVGASTMNVGYYGAQGWGLTYNDGVGGFPGSYKIQSLATPPYKTWSHIACSRVSGVTRLFINGVQVGGSLTDTTSYAAGNTQIGNTTYSPLGYISNVRILKGTGLYSGAFTPPTAPFSAITNTSLLLPMTNAAIFDHAMICDLETVGNARISTAVKKYGTGALYFDGSGDYLQIASNSALILGAASATVEFWIYPLAVDGYRRIITSTSGGFVTGDFVIRYNNGTFLAGSGGTNVNAGTLPPANQWSHVAWVGVGGTAQTLYINGVSVGTAGSYNVTVPIQLLGGWYSLNTTEFFNGYLDDVRVTKGIARYTGNFTPPAAAFNNQ